MQKLVTVIFSLLASKITKIGKEITVKTMYLSDIDSIKLLSS